MTGGGKVHWESVHSNKHADQVSWWQPEPNRSLQLIEASGVSLDDPVIDVGAGASTLVDHVLAAGYRDVTVLDVAQAALEQVRERLGERAGEVGFIEADITRWVPRSTYALWHDRAAFHFLVNPDDRKCYHAALTGALRPGGQVIISTFGMGGPERCSGLDTVRYSAATLRAELGDDFELMESVNDIHTTPWGAEQAFLFCRFKRTTS